jgi:hypothetical protein
MVDHKNEFEIQPPWAEYPDSDPVWSGWRQGYSEEWLLKIWLPFWQGLSPEECDRYLRKHPPPDDEWDYYLNLVWRR